MVSEMKWVILSIYVVRELNCFFFVEKTSHSDEKYVQLFVKVHDLNKIETELLNRLKTEEERERQLLTFYLENVRKSFQV